MNNQCELIYSQLKENLPFSFDFISGSKKIKSTVKAKETLL